MRPAMTENLLHSELFLMTLTVAVYYGAMRLYRRFQYPLLNPLLISMAVLIGLLRLIGVDYQTYYEANTVLNFFLKLSIVALGYLLYTNLEHIRDEKYSILGATVAGSLIGVVSVLTLAYLLGADRAVAASLQPKSVTMPIALSLSEHFGGIPALTSVAVVAAGILGSALGPWFLRLIGVRTPVAKGLALGAASHVVGTAKALEMGAVEGAIGGAAIGLMGIMTAILLPIVARIL